MTALTRTESEMEKTGAPAIYRCLLLLIIPLLLVPYAHALTITHNPTSDVQLGSDYAVIKWTTDEAANSTILYGAANLDNSMSNSSLDTAHSFNLTSLFPATEYSYKLISNDSSTAVMSFKTAGSEARLLSFEKLPEEINTNKLEIKGAAPSGSRITVFVNREINNMPQYDEVIPSSSFDINVILDPLHAVEGIVGVNTIEVDAFRGHMHDKREFNVSVDTVAPSISFSSIPSYTANSTLKITGTTDSKEDIEIFLNGNSQGGVKPDDNGVFSYKLPLTEGKNTIKAVATDSAGNKGEARTEITLDKKSPVITITSSKDSTHSSVYKVEGHTDEPSDITIINVNNYVSYEEFNTQVKKMTRISTAFGALGIVVGKNAKTHTDSNNNFKGYVHLLMGDRNTQGVNHIVVVARDRAGNEAYKDFTITFIPGCVEWTLSGTPRTTPFNIYYNNLISAPFRAGILLNLGYSGRGIPTNIRVSVTPDGSKGQNQLVTLKKSKASPYRPGKGVVVFTPLDIRMYGGRTKDYPGKLELHLKLHISYEVDGNPEDCTVYAQPVFGVQKPADLMSHFSEKQINDTITSLDTLINVTSYAYDKAMMLYRWNLYACTAAGALYYATHLTGNGCKDDGSGGDALKKMLWICDRIMCPNTPPDCSKTFKGPEKEQTVYAQQGSATVERKEKVFSGSLGNEDTAVIRVVDVSRKGGGVDVSKLVGEERRMFNVFCGGLSNIHSVIIYQEYDKKTGKKVSSNIYCSDKDISKIKPSPETLPEGACYDTKCPEFNQVSCVFGGADEEPAGDIISALKCGCTPAIAGYLSNYMTVFQGMRTCITEAKEGRAKPGLCQKLFAVFVCDNVKTLFKHFVPSKKVSYGGRENIINAHAKGKSINRIIKDRYSGILAGRSKFGLSTNSVTNKFCLAAVSWDWSSFEEATENFAESINIEPMVSLSVDSYPAQFDPFTGKLNIAYHFYVGIIPGGPINNLKLTLMCDPNFPNGNLCSPNAPMIAVPGVPYHLDRGRVFDKAFTYNVDDSRWWYNKAVLSMDYTVGGKKKILNLERKVKRRGELAYECDFSTVNGISCESPLIGQEGIVELYGQAQGTRLSPPVSAYFTGNIVNLKVSLANQYKNSFIIVLNGSTPEGKNRELHYKVSPQSYSGTNQVFDLPFFFLGSGNAQQSYYFEGDKSETLPSGTYFKGLM